MQTWTCEPQQGEVALACQACTCRKHWHRNHRNQLNSVSPVNAESQGGKVWLACYGSYEGCNDVGHLQHVCQLPRYSSQKAAFKAYLSAAYQSVDQVEGCTSDHDSHCQVDDLRKQTCTRS